MICRKLYPAFRLKTGIDSVCELNQFICRKQPKNGYSQVRLQPPAISFCTRELPKNTNVFGDISGRKFQHIKMDEFEQEQEKFEDTEACVPRRMKPSIGQYGHIIKSHLSRKDLDSAINVLDEIKANRDKPTVYIYNLLMRALSMQGDLKRCFHLYNKMKKNALNPNEATYTCLFNACAMSDNKELALKHLTNLRQSLYEKQFSLNQTHYNVMIKAYGWHNQVGEAFTLVDEMMDNHIGVGDSTFNSLFHAAIADKDTGLRHALATWHLMYRWNIKRSLTTYNLLLRTIRDSNLKDVKINDVLIPNYELTRILLKEGERPDLLSSPPFVSSMLLLTETKQKDDRQHSLVRTNEQNLPANIPINLNNALMSNRLILFGGIEGILNRMAADNVKPDAKTITLFLDLIPNTAAAEDLLLKIADEKNVQLDIDFYNMLIKRRSMRCDYKAAKNIVQIAEKKSLTPNVMTFGVLALACQEYYDVKEFLEGMEAFGYKPNVIIMSTLLKTACVKENFGFLLLVMDYMVENKIKPSEKAFKILVEFSKKIPNMRTPKGKGKSRKLKNLEEKVYRFEQTLSKWQQANEKKNL